MGNHVHPVANNSSPPPPLLKNSLDKTLHVQHLMYIPVYLLVAMEIDQPLEHFFKNGGNDGLVQDSALCTLRHNVLDDVQQ